MSTYGGSAAPTDDITYGEFGGNDYGYEPDQPYEPMGHAEPELPAHEPSFEPEVEPEVTAPEVSFEADVEPSYPDVAVSDSRMPAAGKWHPRTVDALRTLDVALKSRVRCCWERRR